MDVADKEVRVRLARKAPTEQLLLAVTVGVAAGALGVGASGGWVGTAVDCTAEACFCEETHDGWLRQPVNTLSNLVAILFAAALAFRSHRQRCRSRGRDAKRPLEVLLGHLFPVVIAFQGTGSMFFHASLLGWGATLDAFSMFASGGLLLCTNLVRLGWIEERRLLPTWLLVLVSGSGAALWSSTLVSPLMFVLVLGTLGSEVIVARSRRYSPALFRLGVAIFLVGLTFWSLSVAPGSPLCDPASLLQPHALWHVTSALAVSLFALHATADLRTYRVPPSPG